MNVVRNAGPLIAPGKLGQLGLLLKLYGKILIPHEVYTEVVVNGLRVGAVDAQVVDFLVRQGHIQVIQFLIPSCNSCGNLRVRASTSLPLRSGRARYGCSCLCTDST